MGVLVRLWTAGDKADRHRRRVKSHFDFLGFLFFIECGYASEPTIKRQVRRRLSRQTPRKLAAEVLCIYSFITRAYTYPFYQTSVARIAHRGTGRGCKLLKTVLQ